MPLLEAIYTIPFATISIYATDLSGNASGDPLWTGACIEDLKLSDSIIQEFSQPSGARYEIAHARNEKHTIEADGLMDFSWSPIRNTTYLLYLTWLQADKITGVRAWRDRTYFDIVPMASNVGGRGENGSAGNIQSRTWSAAFYMESNGSADPPVPPGPASSTQA